MELSDRINNDDQFNKNMMSRSQHRRIKNWEAEAAENAANMEKKKKKELQKKIKESEAAMMARYGVKKKAKE